MADARGAGVLAGLRAKSALVLGDCRSPHLCNFPETGALFAMQDTRWDHALKVTGGGTGLVGHAGAVLLRKAADQAGLTAGLSAALRKAGTSPLLDRGIVLVSMAAAIALGATSMSDIAVLAHLAPVLGEAPSGPTIRRALDLAGTAAMLDRIARARARARAHVWTLIERHARRVPVAGHRREDAGRVAGHRHGRHAGHRPVGQGRSGSDLEERLRLPPAGGVVREYPRVPGHAAAPRQRRVKHVHRPPGRAGRGDPAGPGPVPGARSWSASTGPAPATSSSSTCCRCPPRAGQCCSPAAG